jgi:hypothetical protein
MQFGGPVQQNTQPEIVDVVSALLGMSQKPAIHRAPPPQAPPADGLIDTRPRKYGDGPGRLLKQCHW